MQPVVDGLEQEYGNRIAFQRLNAAREGQALFQRYNLPGHPAFVIVDQQDNVVWRFIGQTTRETLEQAIRHTLGP